MNEKEITLNFKVEQVANDILANCNAIKKTLGDDVLADIKSSIQTPDDPESRSIINRALTEAFGNLKVAFQRYLKVGRTSDNNLLERMVSSIDYKKDGAGNPTSEIDKINYEEVTLKLYIPNFNVSVTHPLESHSHSYLVSFCMAEFLKDLYPDKADSYAGRADKQIERVVLDLQARDTFNLRKPSWI